MLKKYLEDCVNYFNKKNYTPLYNGLPVETLRPMIVTPVAENPYSSVKHLLNYYIKTGSSLYLLRYSPWPFALSVTLVHTALVLVGFFDSISYSYFYLFYTTVILISIIFRWLFDVSIESLKGVHNSQMRYSFTVGFLLFILSEVMFFFSLFWAFFNFSLSSNIWLLYWPPQGIVEFVSTPTAGCIPALNTFLLLFSGFLLTISHELFTSDVSFRLESLFFLLLTIFFGFLFLVVQYIEFKTAIFSFNDSVYSSTVFFLTGFHGFHVVLGVVALCIAFYRNLFYFTTVTEHQGFEFAIWYWHFVDVVWFFVYYFVYIWGNATY